MIKYYLPESYKKKLVRKWTCHFHFQAFTMRPSIIFFDEIDGLAPVRSSRQDQIHSSIVSTLLALMDGLDSRGEIVVIGATNRIDAIDPALRRPGRFDREFQFSLPDKNVGHISFIHCFLVKINLTRIKLSSFEDYQADFLTSFAVVNWPL